MRWTSADKPAIGDATSVWVFVASACRVSAVWPSATTLQSDALGMVLANLHLFLMCLLALALYCLGQRGDSAVGFVPNTLKASSSAEGQLAAKFLEVERLGYDWDRLFRRLAHCHAANVPRGDDLFAAVVGRRVGRLQLGRVITGMVCPPPVSLPPYILSSSLPLHAFVQANTTASCNGASVAFDVAGVGGSAPGLGALGCGPICGRRLHYVPHLPCRRITAHWRPDGRPAVSWQEASVDRKRRRYGETDGISPKPSQLQAHKLDNGCHGPFRPHTAGRP